MASKSNVDPSLSGPLEGISRELACGVCQELLRQPVLNHPCHHPTCQACYPRQKNKKGERRCWTCQEHLVHTPGSAPRPAPHWEALVQAYRGMTDVDEERDEDLGPSPGDLLTRAVSALHTPTESVSGQRTYARRPQRRQSLQRPTLGPLFPEGVTPTIEVINYALSFASPLLHLWISH